MKCPICDEQFNPKRADAKTCGKPACRKAMQRKQNPPTKKRVVEKIDQPAQDVLPPKSQWWSALVPFEPIMDKYQPLNGDVYCEHASNESKLLKAAYPKGKGTDLLARDYVRHVNDHQETCSPMSKNRTYKVI